MMEPLNGDLIANTLTKKIDFVAVVTIITYLDQRNKFEDGH